MSKYAAFIKIGWVKQCFEENTPTGIIRNVEKIRNFDCFLRMGRMQDHESIKKI